MHFFLAGGRLPGTRSAAINRGGALPAPTKTIELGKELSEQDIKDWDYEQKIDQYLDLDLFRALEEVYVPQKTVPPLRQLAELMRHKGSPDTQKRVVLKMEKAWQEGLEDLELRSTRRLPLNLTNWEDEEIFPLGHTKKDTALILHVDRGTLYNWINAKLKKIYPSQTGHIPISEIKRLRRGDAPVIE